MCTFHFYDNIGKYDQFSVIGKSEKMAKIAVHLRNTEVFAKLIPYLFGTLYKLVGGNVQQAK